MSVFDLLFLAAAAASIVTLIAAAVAAVRGRLRRSAVVVRNWAICAVVYVVAGIAVSYFEPQRILSIGDDWCFDDWCLRVESVQRTPLSYRVALRISSRARRVSQRAKGAWIFLIDEGGRRYPPEPDPSAVPLDVRLGPGESVSTARVFRIPPGVRALGLITGHGGDYCGPMSFLIVGGSQCLFGRPDMIRIQ